MENVMSYVSENSAEVRDLSATEIELIGGGFSPSLSAAIKDEMGLAGCIRRMIKMGLDAQRK